MSAAMVILPVVWATATIPQHVERRTVAPELAFYRKYTEGMLRRYVRLSMEAGKVPSLIGQEMFRGRVTNYAVHSFEDVVIFVHDVEKCLARLDDAQQLLIRRIGLQEFTQGETAALTGLSIRTVNRRYSEALDRLTEIFLKLELLRPSIACQEDEGLPWVARC